MDTRILVLLALAATAIAGPITLQESDKCAIECTTSTNYEYATGYTYIYDYSVDTATSMSGASEDTAKLTLSTTANIEVLNPCEFALKLTGTRLFHSDGNGGIKAADRENQFRRSLESSTLRFSFQNGIVDNICADDREDAWALNIKKGLLSAFQNSMDDLSKDKNVTEVDVSGSCQVEYKVVSNGYYTTTVKKVKDVLTCTDRHSYKTMLKMVPYKIPSDLQSMPLMKTTHECEQEIQKGGVLKSSKCEETHVYRPFSNGRDGGATTVKQTLTYKTSSRGTGTQTSSVSNRDSLVFDHSATKLSGQQARFDVEEKLRTICESTAYDIRPETPRQFSELVVAMRSLDKVDMGELQKLLKTETMCPTNDRAYKFFLDALPMVSTGASVNLMTTLIINEDVSSIQAKAWIASLAFITKPTSAMLLDVKALVDSEKFHDDALLPVSSMVNNFCTANDDYAQSYAVLSIVASLERNIGYNCDASGKNFNNVLMALRAIGNAGHATRAIAVINKCLTYSSNPMEIRVAAANAFRRMPCDAEDNDLWSIFENADLDSELRIAAYLAIIRCPSDKNLGKMAASLENEENDQVGAFVYSHMKNLRETSDPHKQNVARSMDNLYLTKEFDTNLLKFSRNIEASALLNKINTGFVAESNLIWSSETQLPRSVSGNLTVDLFGHSINLVDFGGRLEGLEYLIKNLFGPYMGEKGMSKMNADDVQGSIYGRFFGNEMFFLHSKQIRSPFKDLPNSWLDVLIALSKNQEFAFTQSAQVMDVSMVIPTSAGLPINVDVNVTGTVDLLVKGKADLRNVGKSPRSMDIDGEIRPSAAVEVTGSMSVDAAVTKTGLRMRNTMHTSTALKGRVQMERGQTFNVEFDTPQDKIEIFDARSKFFIVHNDMEQEQQMITKNRKEFKLCSSNQLAKVTGVELCGEISFPNASLETSGPFFPLTGPVSASVNMYKTDSHTGYKLFAKRVENKKMSVAQISFNTPGSKTDRAILIDLSVNYPKKEIDANMITPWKKASFNGAMIATDKLNSLSGRLTMDNSDVYAVTSEVKISESKGKLQLNPMVELRSPGKENIQLTGFVAVEKPMKSVDIDLSLAGLQKMPYTFKGAMDNTKKIKSLKVSFSDDGKKEYSAEMSNSFIVMGKKSVIATLKNALKVKTPRRELIDYEGAVDYREDKSLKLDGTVDIYRVTKNPVSINIAALKNAKKRGVRYDVDAKIKSSSISGKIDSNVFMKTTGFISTKNTISYTIPKFAKDKIVLGGKFNDRSTKAYKKYTVKGNLDIQKNPQYNLGLNIDVDHKKKHSEAEVELKYGPNPKDKTKRLFFNAALNRKIPNYKNVDVNYKVKAESPAHDVNVFLSGKHKHTPSMLDSDVKLTYGKNKDITAGVFLKDGSTKLTKVNGKVNFAYPGQEYVLNSQLNQKSAKQYEHVMNFKTKTGTKHTISTVYKMPKPQSYDFTTQFDIDGMKKTSISGSTTLDPRAFEAAGEIKRGIDVYGLSTKSKISNAPAARVSVELVVPERRMTLGLDGGKNKNKYDGRIEAAWDADKDKTKKIVIDGAYHHKSNKNSVSFGGNLGFNSPFTNFEDLNVNLKYGSDNNQHDVSTKFSWGGKGHAVLSSLNVKKPFSLRNIDMSVEAKTPFKGYRVISGDVKHSIDKTLSTIVKGRWEKEDAKLAIQGEDNSDHSSTNLKGSLSYKSSAKYANDIAATFSHSCRDGHLENNAAYSLDGQNYGYDLTMDHSRSGWSIKNTGDLKLTTPRSKVATNWDHQNSDRDVKCTLTSKWNGDKMFVDFTGSHDVAELRNIDGVLKIQSPWRSIRDVIVSLNHKHGYGIIDHKADFTQNGDSKASSSMKYVRDNGKADFDFTLASPFNNDWSGKMSSQYGRYPMTSLAEFQWTPRNKVTAEGSLNAQEWRNSDFDVKITTPFRDYRSVVLRASNKNEGEQMVSHLNLDYGVRQGIDVEARRDFEGRNKMARVKLTTPFSTMKSLETGFRLDGDVSNFDSSADFELLPVLGKFEGSAQMQYDGELNGKLRLDTPFPSYPYYQLTTASLNKGNGRSVHIEAEHYPRQVYSFDTLYRFELPISFEATINSPYPEYNDLGVIFQHQMSPSSVATNGELRYQPGKKIEGNLNADWASNMEGNLMVKTPFQGFETSKIGLRHQGDIDNFASHGEVNVAEQSFIADASYNSGYTTTGTFTLSTPIRGMENVAFNMKKKGYGNNIRGGATVTINDDKIDAAFNHRLNRDSIKSALKLTSPYTEDLKLSIDHDGMPSSFTNKMSASYGRQYDVDTIASFNYREPDVTGDGVFKYKLGGGRNNARLSFNKNGALTDMSFGGTASYNRDEITVTGAWKNLDSIDGNVQIKTPFTGFNDIGMSLSHYGDLRDFRTNANIKYMDNKNIDGKIEMSNDGFRHLRMSSDVSTPFSSFPSANVNFNHHYDDYDKILNGNMALTTPVAGFGTGTITYSKTGSLDNFAAETAINVNGKDISVLKLSNDIRPTEVHSKLNFDSSELPSLTVTVDHMGTINNFNSKASGVLGRNSVYGEISKKGPLDDMSFSGSARYNRDEINVNGEWKNRNGIDGSIDIKTPFRGFKDIGASLSHSGALNDFSSNANIKYMNDKNIVGKVNFNNGYDNTVFGAQVNTPFRDFNDIGISLSHSSGMNDFSSNANIRYMDNKNIAGKVSFNKAYGSTKFDAELTTPFTGFESTKMEANTAYDGYANDVQASATLTSTINSFGTGTFKYSKSGSLRNLVVECSLEKNGDEMSVLKITNDYSDKNLNTVFNYRCTVIPEIFFTIQHTGDMNSFNTKTRGSIGKYNVVSGEANLNQRGDNVDVDGTFVYTTERYGGNQASMNFHKDGSLDNFNFKATGKLNSKESTVSGSLKMQDEVTGSVTINTPVRGYKNVGMSFKHSGNLERFNSEGEITLADGEKYSGKVDFYRYLFSRIQTTAELRTPISGYEFTKFEYRHEEESDGFKCYSTLEYGRSNKITYDLSASMTPQPDFSVSIKTPFDDYEELMASATLEQNWPKYGITSKVNAGNGRIVTVNGAFDASNDLSGSLSVSTPIDGFTDVGANFDISGKLQKFTSEAKVTYMDGQDISGKVDFRLRGPRVTAELKTPFSGMEFTSYELTVSNSNVETSSSTKFVYGDNKVISSDAVIAYMPKPGFTVTLKTPYYGYEDMMAAASAEGSWPKYAFHSKVDAGRNQMYTFNGAFDATSDISGNIDLHTPIDGFTDVGASFQHSGNAQKFDSEAKLTYLDNRDIAGKVSFYRYMWRRLVATAELNTPFSGLEQTKTELNYEDNSNSISTTAALEYGNGQKMNGNMKLTYSPTYDALITLNTPFYDYRVIRAQGSLDTTAPSYAASYSVNYGYNKAYSANGKLNFYSVDNIDGTVEVSLPVPGYEFTKVEYMHKADPRQLDSSASLTYGNGQVISGDLKTAIQPNFDATLNVKTPFYGYKNMKATATFDKGYKKYDASSSLNLGRGMKFAMTSGVDYSVEPMRVSTKLSTPYSDFKNVEFVLTHEGALNNFDTTGFFSSPITDNINAEAKLNYKTLSDMFASASLKTSMVGMDDLKAEVKNSDYSGEKKSRVVVGWTDGQEVVLDGLVRSQEGWYENKYHTDVSMSTPFIAVKNVALRFDHTGKDSGLTEKVEFELNGDKLLDVDGEYSSQNKREATVTFRQPWPMQYTANVDAKDQMLDAEVVANWNRDAFDSNVRLTASLSDKSNSYQIDRSVELGWEQANRKMGMSHQLTASSTAISSNGKLFWDKDDDSKISYDMQVNDNSRRRKEMMDGSFKVGLPSRTLALSGSYSDNRVVKASDATFSWDAGRDDSKQVGLKATMTRGDRAKGEVTLSMPAIRKEIRVESEMMMHNGRVIFDTKTDISYSPDSRKTLTLMSKLEDIRDYYSNYNYSLELGISHPYTHVDVRMVSHLGSSDEKMTLGMTTNYLTATRQNKNVALLAEINKLKKQINLQFTNPMNKIELMGDIVSTKPYKVNFINKIDDMQAFQADFTLDSDKKVLTLSTNMDSQNLVFTALYPNNTAFRAEVSRHNAFEDETEGLFTMRLNTSRLLHTRIHWCPKIPGELRSFIQEKLATKGARALETISVMNEAVAEELSGKYTDITNAFVEEARPLVDKLHREMAMVSRAISDMSAELRVMYQNNDFYIQDFATSYMDLQEQLAALNREYREQYTTIIQSLRDGLSEMSNFNVRDQYYQMIDNSVNWFNEKLEKALSCLETKLAKIDAALQQYQERYHHMKAQARDMLYNNTYVDYMSNKVNQLTDVDIKPYISSFSIPEEYTNAIYSVHSAALDKVGTLLDRPEIRYVKGGMNEVYQQGVWAYNYWQLEKNIHKHAKNIVELIREIIEEELKEYVETAKNVYKNPITVWDPEHGELQAQFVLPVEVKRLDEMPDVSPLVNKVEAFAAKYLPDASTVEKITDAVSDMWPEESGEDEVNKMLKKYKPKRKLRKMKGRKYMGKKYRQ